MEASFFLPVQLDVLLFSQNEAVCDLGRYYVILVGAWYVCLFIFSAPDFIVFVACKCWEK